MPRCMFAMCSEGDIEAFNALPIAEFRTRFWPTDEPFLIAEKLPWLFTLESSSTISSQDLAQCFQLISDTSSSQYAASSMGWHPAKKRKEMLLPDLKYVLMKQESEDCDFELQRSPVDGFLSFMLTYEDGMEVIYCYEIHLQPQYQGRGMGKVLLRHMEEVGMKVGIRKTMLTVFRANEPARAFYESIGYGEDEYSPRPRKLRGGKVKEADYIILSKVLTEERDTCKSEKAALEKEIVDLKEESDKHQDENHQERKAP